MTDSDSSGNEETMNSVLTDKHDKDCDNTSMEEPMSDVENIQPTFSKSVKRKPRYRKPSTPESPEDSEPEEPATRKGAKGTSEKASMKGYTKTIKSKSSKQKFSGRKRVACDDSESENEEQASKVVEDFPRNEVTSDNDEVTMGRSKSAKGKPKHRNSLISKDLNNRGVFKSSCNDAENALNDESVSCEDEIVSKRSKSAKQKSRSRKSSASKKPDNSETEETASKNVDIVASDEPDSGEDEMQSEKSKIVKPNRGGKKSAAPKIPAQKKLQNFVSDEPMSHKDETTKKRSRSAKQRSRVTEPSVSEDTENSDSEGQAIQDENIRNHENEIGTRRSISATRDSRHKDSSALGDAVNSESEEQPSNDAENVENDVPMSSEDETETRRSKTAKRKSKRSKSSIAKDPENSKAQESAVNDSAKNVGNDAGDTEETNVEKSKAAKRKSRRRKSPVPEDSQHSETEDGVKNGRNDEPMSIEDPETDARSEPLVGNNAEGFEATKAKKSNAAKQKSRSRKSPVPEDSEDSETEESAENGGNDEPMNIEDPELGTSSESVQENESNAAKRKSRGKRSSVPVVPKNSETEEPVPEGDAKNVRDEESMSIGDPETDARSEPLVENYAKGFEKTKAKKSQAAKQKSRSRKSPVPEDSEDSEIEESAENGGNDEPMNIADPEADTSFEPVQENESKAAKRKSRGKRSVVPEVPKNSETEEPDPEEDAKNVRDEEPMNIEDAETSGSAAPAPGKNAQNAKGTKTKKSTGAKRISRGKKHSAPEAVENSENVESASEDEENVGNEGPESIEDDENDEHAEATTSKTTNKSKGTKTKNSKPTKRKSKTKKSPNPRPKKKPKKQRNYDFLKELLEYEDIPLNAKLILQKDDALEVLTAAEINTLFETLSDAVKAAAELVFENLNNPVALKWLKSVSLLMICIVENLPADEPFPVEIEVSVPHVASLLGTLQKLDIDVDVKEYITEACSLLLLKDCEFSDQIFFLTVSSLVDFVVMSPAKSPRCKKSIKLLHSLEGMIARLQITSKACEPFVAKFVSVVQCKDALTVKEGKEFVSFLLTLDMKLLPKFHQAIKDTLPLPQVKKVHANGYGEAYYLAWLHSAGNKEMRQAIEQKCFQNYMLAIFRIQRSGLEMSALGHNVFTILSCLHSKREHMRLSKTITTLYTPLLWRFLRFENNLIRCNAAEVFFDVYPLEYHGETKPERIMHLDRQHQEMADLLIDNCHLVRVIALRGVFACMKALWATFPPESLQKLVKIIINDCINDGSSSDVRCAVYRGFTSLLENPQTHEYLATILPNLGNYLNDECDKVRVAFVKLLQKVKDADIEYLKYWHISDVKLLTARLAKEKNESVSKALTELLFSNIFSKNNDESLTMKRLIRLIQMNPVAARKLIQYSPKLLPYKDALRLMLIILASMRSHIMEKIKRFKDREEAEAAAATAAEEDDVPDDKGPKLKKRRKHSRPLSERTNNINDDSSQDTSKSSSGESNESRTEESYASSQSDKKSPFDELTVSHGLFDIVCLLWIIHAKTLNSPEKAQDLEDLYEMAMSMIAMMLKYFKGTETFFGVLQVASLIPLSKLSPVSNIASACISQLRHYGHVLPREECRCIVTSLCAWNRGIDILELVYDWFNEAFKVENLNFSAFPMNKGAARKKKIRFETIEVKPLCGLDLLHMIFSNPVDKNRVLTKSYEQVMELFNYLERIKDLIEKRIKNEEEFSSEFLSDKFLSSCLLSYLKLAIVLHKEPENDASMATVTETFSATDFYLKILQWCESTLVGSLDRRPDRTVCSFVNAIVQAGSIMLAINQANKQIMAELLKVLSRCLGCGENGLLVLENAVKILNLTLNVSLNHYSAKNLRHVYVSTAPHFLEAILSAATYRNYDQETIIECVDDIVGMKKAMRDILQNYDVVHAKDKTNSILPRIINVLTKAIVQCFTLEVLKHNVVISTIKLNNLPFFANFLLTLVNSRPAFCSIFLTCLNRNVSELYLNNAPQLLATISLLFTLAMNKFKFKPVEFSATVKLTNDVLMKYRAPPEETQLNESTASSGIIDQAHNLDEQDVQIQGAQLIQQISEKIGLLV